MNPQYWLITGCSRGIGQVLARAAMQQGHHVAATARKRADLDSLKAEFPGLCLPLVMDMNDESGIEAAVQELLKLWPRVDVLVNNAGYGLQGIAEEVSMAQVRQQLETNFFGLVRLTQLIIPVMRKHRSGYVVNVSSMAGLRGMGGFGIYNASKFAVEGFTEALAQEVAPFGIRVSAIEPGPYRTDWAGDSLMRSEAMVSLDEGSAYAAENKRLKEMLDSRSGRQPGDPRQIAAVLLEAARHPAPPLRMVFGDVAIQAWKDRTVQFGQPAFISFYPHDQYTL